MADLTSKGADEENCSGRSGGMASSEVKKQSSSSLCLETSGNGDGVRLYLSRDLRIGLLFAGLAVSCLLLYNSTNPLKFFPTSYYSSVGGSPMGRNVSLDVVLKSAAMEDNRTVILTTLNDAWAEPGSVFDLFLESFRVGNGTRKLLDHLVVVALDKKAYDRCLAVHRHCFALTTKGMDFSGEADFMSADYLEMMWRRINFLRVVLKKGYNFVFTDTDIMWFRSPFPHFYSDTDFQIACDYYYFDPADKRNSPNGGFTYARSNNRTVKFYEFWYESRKSYLGKHDQDVLNEIKSHKFLDDIGLQMRFLDTAYIGGFCQLSRDLNRICTMHANCCVGLDNKIQDLSATLDDWRKYLASGSGDWSVPKACVGSLGKPHKPHRRGLFRRR
ncbi:uncharacterized protein At4g15970-like [Punica granatum]|uniref:Nucleotide-diphospho-sugar transferase domain-containing protein n=2 Tax=Punica granatum TaxID=22663 RepID=A0A218VRP3_PUNGR|nr:uncharacterized protein At4g15970-like [Punica granatum]XP_031405082.1 uncharacterized protein At4g15970-like [Punica granatum]XP_031405083.1 uncharacterized protein At4g15970-like [Punica granatum]OWM62691.1 hypothetical protein CDL15_Pgr019985 [Punica granatum]PKI63321.1 hypothetical protein CRG98_016312 [Punica granatum]